MWWHEQGLGTPKLYLDPDLLSWQRHPECRVAMRALRRGVRDAALQLRSRVVRAMRPGNLRRERRRRGDVHAMRCGHGLERSGRDVCEYVRRVRVRHDERAGRRGVPAGGVHRRGPHAHELLLRVWGHEPRPNLLRARRDRPWRLCRMLASHVAVRVLARACVHSVPLVRYRVCVHVTRISCARPH